MSFSRKILKKAIIYLKDRKKIEIDSPDKKGKSLNFNI